MMDGQNIKGHYLVKLTTSKGELIETIRLNGANGYELPLGAAAEEDLADTINRLTSQYEAENPPPGEVPI